MNCCHRHYRRGACLGCTNARPNGIGRNSAAAPPRAVLPDDHRSGTKAARSARFRSPCSDHAGCAGPEGEVRQRICGRMCAHTCSRKPNSGGVIDSVCSVVDAARDECVAHLVRRAQGADQHGAARARIENPSPRAFLASETFRITSASSGMHRIVSASTNAIRSGSTPTPAQRAQQPLQGVEHFAHAGGERHQRGGRDAQHQRSAEHDRRLQPSKDDLKDRHQQHDPAHRPELRPRHRRADAADARTRRRARRRPRPAARGDRRARSR